jgi:thioesterase domain-containing protein/acyl carrier protein
VPGELCTAGEGLSCGYLNRPELTAEKFVDRIYISRKIYKTGDLCRWLADGNIEFLGRMDFQVKIRGFRIELEEIQRRLAAHESVTAVVVIDQVDKSGDKYLCAYVVPNNREPVEPGLKNYLSALLPGYMIPSHFIEIDKIPLTSNGKIDRKALPAPGLKQEDYTAPRDGIERKLVAIWSEVLGIEKEEIGIDDDFFHLGGHSLKATMVVSGINRELDVRMPLIEFFKTATIRTLAEYVGGEEAKILPLKDEQLVLLKKGNEKAGIFFFIHDGSGDVERYIEFCRQLKGEFTYWGIRAQRLENYTPRNLVIEKVAPQYIEKIRVVQPHGPYRVAGWSIGGTIAFEMVRCLEAQNEEAVFLGLIDTVPPDQDSPHKGSEFNFELELKAIRRYFPDETIIKKLQSIRDFHRLWPGLLAYLEESKFRFNVDADGNVDSGNGFINAVLENFSKFVPNPHKISIKEFISYLNMVRTFENARDKYIPGGNIHTVVYFFKAGEGETFDARKWGIYCTKPVKIYDIPGDHFSIFKMPGVKEFAHLFDKITNN